LELSNPGVQGHARAQPPTAGHCGLYTSYTRACDPVLEFLKMGGQHSDEQIGELVRCTLF